MLLSFASRPLDNNTTFSTGGDVSRFQRRTVPGKPVEAGSQPGAATGPGKGMTTVPTGPVIRIARGNDVTTVPAGAR